MDERGKLCSPGTPLGTRTGAVALRAQVTRSVRTSKRDLALHSIFFLERGRLWICIVAARDREKWHHTRNRRYRPAERCSLCRSGPYDDFGFQFFRPQFSTQTFYLAIPADFRDR